MMVSLFGVVLLPMSDFYEAHNDCWQSTSLLAQQYSWTMSSISKVYNYRLP